VKVSQHIALVGIIVTMAASLDLSPFGSTSSYFPVLLSIFSCNSENLQAM